MNKLLEELIGFILGTSIVFMCIFLGTKCANADTAFKYGLGVFHSAEYSPTETKFMSLSYQSKYTGLVTQYEGGFWTDIRDDAGRRGSWFVSASGGVNVDLNRAYVQWLVGPAYISHTDAYLGGNFQFNNDLGIGVKDENNYSIGLNFKHMSSAGIYQPNKGRDFLLLRVSVPW